MFKFTRLLFSALTLHILFNVYSYANEKTPTNTLPEQCVQMLKITEKLIADAARQPGTHTQVSELKKKLKSTKEELSHLDAEMQHKSCEKGLNNLNTLKQKH